MDELDVALGFASLADDMKFVRPILNEGYVEFPFYVYFLSICRHFSHYITPYDNRTSYQVQDGRHPTVEMGLLVSGRTFTPNSLSLNTSSTSTGILHFITGPNMSGKSSFLRQTALISILAQTGSYVPASSATLGIVDRVFSRVGASDDLTRDKSTFMVEMLESAEILKRATSRSLVIMDEVGRGTTTKDGMAIAFATVAYLVGEKKCRCLFASHFHEVADMLAYTEGNVRSETFPAVDFYCTDVDVLEVRISTIFMILLILILTHIEREESSHIHTD